MRWISLVSSGHSIQMDNNTSSQVHMGHSPEKPTSWGTNQTSVNLRKLKSYQSSHNAVRLDINYQKKKKKKKWRKHKHMENKQHVSK